MHATVPPRMNGPLFDDRCAAKGAHTDTEIAALLGVAVSTIGRWRDKGQRPRVDMARHVAATLGVTVDDLWPVR